MVNNIQSLISRRRRVSFLILDFFFFSFSFSFVMKNIIQTLQITFTVYIRLLLSK